MNDMYQQLAQKVYAVLDAYSNQNKFTLVLDTSAQQTPVLWANQASDITKTGRGRLQRQVRRSSATSCRRPRRTAPEHASSEHNTAAQHDQAAAVERCPGFEEKAWV